MKTLERLLLTALRDLAALQQKDALLRTLTRPTRLTVSRGLKRARKSIDTEASAILLRTAHVAAQMLRAIGERDLKAIAARFDIAPMAWHAREGS